MLRAAIFDMDGTLLDSMHVWNTVGEDYLRTKGKVPPDGFVERVRALGMRETADYLRSELGVEDPPGRGLSGNPHSPWPRAQDGEKPVY